MKNWYWSVFLVCILMSCGIRKADNPLDLIMETLGEKYAEVLADPESFGLQVLYTQIDRDNKNQPHLRTWAYRVDTGRYFYPASTVKLPVALLALEKIHKLNLPGLKSTSFMLTDSAYSGQTSVLYDSSAESLRPSIAHYIKKIFLVSDNDAFNRLYEFLGQEYLNEALKKKGFDNTGIIHRLSVFLSQEENRHTNPVRFYNDDTLVYQQPQQAGRPLFTDRGELRLGKGYMLGDSLVQAPMDFTRKNFMSLQDLHNTVVEVIFPGKLKGYPLFDLSEEEYRFLYKYMSMYPGESDFPYYGDKYDDNYCKFIMYGDHYKPIPRNIRLFNKVGLAYGFVVDAAYVVDFEQGVEFFLSAVIDVNRNRIYMDDHYAYDELAYPFLADLGKAVYHYEINRERDYIPDLSRFNLAY